MQAADTACYAAKEGGRNRVHAWFDTDRAMRRATARCNGPRASRRRWTRTASSCSRSASALDGCGTACGTAMRGAAADGDADGALGPPGAFLPAAERFHLAARIDRWVLAAGRSLAARPGGM